MSTEEDIATIEAVTAKVAGPLKVWVLELCGDHDGTALCWTREGALREAELDMVSVASLTPEQIEEHMAELRRDNGTRVDGKYDYFISQMEILP